MLGLAGHISAADPTVWVWQHHAYSSLTAAPLAAVPVLALEGCPWPWVGVAPVAGGAAASNVALVTGESAYVKVLCSRESAF